MNNFRGLIFLLLSLAPQNIAHAESYSVQGFFSYQYFIQDKPQDPSLRTFALSYSDGSWQIAVRVIGDTNFDQYLYTYDRSNLLYFAIPAHPQYTNSIPGAVLEQRPVPYRINFGVGEYLWLAYLSGHYFKDLTNSVALSLDPLRSSAGHVKRYETPCNFELSLSAPFAPLRVRYSVTNLAGLNESGKLVSYPLPEPMEQGYICADFKSAHFTNVDGLSLPLEFECNDFAMPPKPQTSSDLRCIAKVQGWATNFSIGPQNIPESPASGKFVVQDLRAQEPAVTYMVSHGTIPSLEDTNVLAAIQKAQIKIKNTKAKLRAHSGVPIRKPFLVAILTIFLIAPFLSLLKRQKNKQNTANTPNAGLL